MNGCIKNGTTPSVSKFRREPGKSVRSTGLPEGTRKQQQPAVPLPSATEPPGSAFQKTADTHCRI